MELNNKTKILLIAAGVVGLAAIITAFINITIFYVLLGVTAFLGIFWACYNYKWARYVTAIVCFLALAGGSIYSGISLNTYYNAEGGVFGKISNVFNTNQVEEVEDLSFNFSNVEMLATENAGEYSAQISRDKILTLDTDQTFGVYVNDSPCGFVETGVDYVRANYDYVFYGEEKDEIMKDTLQFRFALNKTSTEFTIKTQGGESAVRLWNYYFAKNNFVVSIRPADYVYSNNGLGFSEGEVDYALANYYVNDQKYLTQLYHIGEEVNFPFPTQISTTFLGWSTDKTNVVNTFKINQTTDFYAVEGQEILYTVTYKFKDDVVTTQRIVNGQKAEKPTHTFTGYTFNYWADETGAEFDFNTPVTQDVTLTANTTAEKQTIKLYFALADNQSKYVGLGRLFLAGNQTPKVIASEGEYTKAITVLADSGEDFKLWIKNGNWFKLQTDSMGHIKYVVKDYDSINGTNQVETSILGQENFKTTGFTESGSINLKNVNTDMTILLLVDPIYFNINFYDESTRNILATARGLMYGETFKLTDYLTSDEIQIMKGISGVTGWWTGILGQGEKYFDGNLNMLKPWTDSGYDWNGSSFQPSAYDDVTKTFNVFAYTH